jgi:hypothetical protein
MPTSSGTKENASGTDLPTCNISAAVAAGAAARMRAAKSTRMQACLMGMAEIDMATSDGTLALGLGSPRSFAPLAGRRSG